MKARTYVFGWSAAMLVGVSLGFLLGVLLLNFGPEKAADAVTNTITDTRSYEVGWDVERNTVYRATCQADRCKWERLEWIGWVSHPGLVSYDKDTQIRRGTVVEIDTFGMDQIETQGFGELELSNTPSKGAS